jgi:hypothetical protein
MYSSITPLSKVCPQTVINVGFYINSIVIGHSNDSAMFNDSLSIDEADIELLISEFFIIFD